MKIKIITVQPGDTLWGFAEKHLGDGAMYPDIMVLNAVQLAESIGEELAKRFPLPIAGTQIVVPDVDDDAPFEPSGNV